MQVSFGTCMRTLMLTRKHTSICTDYHTINYTSFYTLNLLITTW
jgi:hypothetical protein